MARKPDPAKLETDDVAARVRAAGLKLTPQRLAIVREISRDPTHPTAQELYERLLPEMPSMSFATVYNTLDALAARGLCSVRALAPGAARFDPNMVPHDHLVCDECGMVRDVESPAHRKPRVTKSELGAEGFVVRSVEQIYRGVCAECASKEKPKTSPPGERALARTSSTATRKEGTTCRS